MSPLLRSSVPIGHAFQIYLEEHLTEMMITYTLANYLQALKKKKKTEMCMQHEQLMNFKTIKIYSEDIFKGLTDMYLKTVQDTNPQWHICGVLI